MILYHGSNVVVQDPEIMKSEIGRDFGPAFYLTPIKEQAERMAKRKQAIEKTINKKAQAIVSVFEWDENINNLAYKDFKEANLEWLELILKCRSSASYKHQFDIVVGKIADDSVGETVSLCLKGYLTKEETLRKLKYQKINSQVAFCTEKSLKRLKFLKSFEVK